MLKKKLRVLLWATSIVYLAVLTKLILFKTHIGSVDYGYMDQYNFYTNLKAVNLIPIKGIISLFGSGNSFMFIFQNIAGNIVLFIPLGFFVFFLHPSATVKKALKIAFFTSLFFEVIQIIFVLGHFDVDDIILNSIGGVTGFFAAKLLVIVYHLPVNQKQLA